MTVTMTEEPAVEADNYAPLEYSEDAIAMEFAERHADDLRYVASLGRWFRWDGGQWCEDETKNIFYLARMVCRKVAAETEKNLSSRKTFAAIEWIAQSDPKLAAKLDQFDADPYLLNTPGGVVDLKTGELRPAMPEDYMTKITAAAPGGECPQFMQFLEQIFPNDPDLIKYVQRALGYCLTGLTIEHALFFGHGMGQNGKGTLLNTVSGIFKDYHTAAATETFTASHGDRHPTELAALRGARLVTTGETATGKSWAEAKIKALTGGDPVTARFMRQDNFTFPPQFKLFITGNKKPALRSVDMAMRRRFHLIPFQVIFAQDQRDVDLPDKLKAEWPGILQWMIDGCLEWQKIGLAPPAAVVDATEDYLSSQDKIATWMEERCEVATDAFEARTDLYTSFTYWLQAAGERPIPATEFYEDLEARDGVRPARIRVNRRQTRGFYGLRIFQGQSFGEILEKKGH